MSEGVEIRQTGGGIRLRLRVKPGGRRQRLIGAYGGALKLEVRAALDFFDEQFELGERELSFGHSLQQHTDRPTKGNPQ